MMYKVSKLLALSLVFFFSVSYIFPSAVMAGTLEFDGVPVDITTADGEDLLLVPGTGGNIQIGDAAGTNSSATSNDDLHITGVLETDGAAYLDGGMVAGSNVIPSLDDTHNLGSSSKYWNNLYVSDIFAGDIAEIKDIAYSFPAAQGGADTFLRNDGAGNLTWAAAAGGSSLPAVDTTSVVEGSADPTKEVRFEVDGLTTGTVRAVTVQDVNGTMYVTGGQDVSLADGGTGASLADPAANRLLGWDDTDNAVKMMVIGSGLSYDQASDTLSATGTAIPVIDTTSIVEGSADDTKEVRFEVDGLTTGTVRTLTVQDVSGTVYVSGGTDIPVADGGTGTSTGSITGTTALTFAAGGTNQNVNLTPSGTGEVILTGNVGIGVADPSSPLHVQGDIRINTGSGGQLFFADGTSMSSASVGSAGSLSNATDAIVTGDSDANGSGDVILKTGSNDRLHILNSGNIGIGNVTDASSALDLNGALTFREMAAPAASGADRGRIYFDATANKFKVSEHNGAYVDLLSSSTDAPTDATYITQTVNGTLTNEQALSSLSTGLVQVTTGTGVLSSVTTSAGVAGLLSDETGTGAVVLANSPAFVDDMSLFGNISLAGSGVATPTFTLSGSGGTTNSSITFKLADASTDQTVIDPSTSYLYIDGNIGTLNGGDVRIYDVGNDRNTDLYVADDADFTISTSAGDVAIPENIAMTGALTFNEISAPATSGADKGRIYFDATANKFKVSEHNAAYVDLLTSSTGAPADATYLTQTANGTLTNEQPLSALATGLMQVTTTTGVVSSVTTSAGVAGLLSDETGSGKVVFDTTPVFITNVTAPLVYGSGAANGDITVEGTSDSTKTTSYVNLQPNGGNVGIGTATPGTKLHVVGAGDNIDAIRVAATDTTEHGFLAPHATLNYMRVGYWKDGGGFGSLILEGNVGIGNTDPSTKLDISGDLTLREIADPGVGALNEGRIYFDATANKFKVSENGSAFTDLIVSGGAASASASYITKTPDASLSQEFALNSLATGLLQVTTASGDLTSITTSAGVGGLISDETGSGGTLVFSTSPVITTPVIKGEAVVALTDAATIATDASLGNVFTVSSAVNRILGIPSNPTTGQKCIWRWKNTDSVAHTLTLTTAGAGAFRFGTTVQGISATPAGKTDYIGAVYNLTDNRWDVIAYAKGYV